MATKKLQILASLIKQAENADTLDGKHASEFASASDVVALQNLVGDTSTSEQIASAISSNIDTTLAQEGKAADAKAVGDQLSALSQRIDNFDYQSGITSIDDGSGNITLQALYIPLSSSDDNQGNVTITM